MHSDPSSDCMYVHVRVCVCALPIQELVYVPPAITPISTPKRKDTPFTFPVSKPFLTSFLGNRFNPCHFCFVNVFVYVIVRLHSIVEWGGMNGYP